jgi:bifunctional UDP-N-acetylglucosamine pyrophosphorylase/glucosamine-1-phosphate N-acetyltransferase
MPESLKVVVLAAGMGTRMKSAKAKVLHRAGGLTLIEHLVRAVLPLVDSPADVVVVVGHQADRVREAVSGSGVRFLEQREQKGTGHAVSLCRELLGKSPGRVVVVYGDCPLLRTETLKRLVEAQRSGAAAVLITTRIDDPSGYGRIIRTGTGAVEAIVEEKAANEQQRAVREINSGIYCFDATALWKHIQELDANPASGEIYLTDIVEIFNRHGLQVAPMVVAGAGELLGINTRVELAEVDRIFRQRKARDLMLAGVTILQPDTVTIDPDVRIGMDTVIEPFAQILGNTVIGSQCRIGSGAIIRDSILEDGVRVDVYTVIGASRLEANAQVGPFARLRMEAHVESGAHIGNFVELKKTRVGAGAKAQHLAYLGDSTIGSGVNIGAGTITCNYDGQRKHETHIGKGAFIGSNSTLVAPVRIGEGSYVAAGSVITEEVPEDNLALGRSRQVNKQGWPSRRKQG